MTSLGDAMVHRPVRVRLLGGFAVDGVDERALGTRKARLLLKRLAVATGRPVPSAVLAAVVWPDGLPKEPADQVSVLVSRLRGVLGTERLPRSDAGYSLAADWFDLVELERRVAELEERLRSGEKASALAAAHAALTLTAGGLLPEEDGDWVDEARPAVERLVARARLLAGEAALNGGEFGAARAAAQSVIDADPYDEAALRLVMRADALTGRPGAALAAYATVRHRLSEDLGADPAPRTEQLHTAIVRGELTTASEVTTGTMAVVGRDGELDLLDALLGRAAEGMATAAVLEAEAGMGKSALLAAWMSRASQAGLVISGRCDELGADLPLQPIVDGLVAHLDGIGREAAKELIGAEASVVDPLLGRATAIRPRATTVANIEAGRAVLFSALAAVLQRAAGDRPLVLVVDDLHQAALGTAEFLAFCLRRASRLVVVAARRPEPGPDLPAAKRLVLGPLNLADVAAVVGEELGPALYERSGGHPLFLRELAAGGRDELPDSLIAVVRARLERLGDAASCVEVAASCGTEVDAALVAAISGTPAPAVLDGIEAAARAGLLRPRGAALAFSHELVREAIEAGTSPPRRAEIHRAAVAELARRPDADALALARHARLGGDPAVAAQALVAAAEGAKDRFEAAAAEGLLDEAVELRDSPVARLARGRLRLARLDLGAAGEDAFRAIELGAGIEGGFELAGWIAYYGRDYDTALRYADEGVTRAAEAGVRASCLALAGRIRHTRGQLAEAAARLDEGVAIAPAGIRGMVQVWQAQLLAHSGEPERAADVARRGLLDPHLAHPFAWGHGRFTLAYAYGVAGRWVDALRAVDELDDLIARQGDKRFPPVAANMRGWLLRGAGLLNQAAELHLFAADSDPGPTFQEARYAALLDLAECHLAGGHVTQAAVAVDAARDVLEWTGSMSWRHRNRFRLLAARLASLDGNHSDAAGEARAVAAGAGERGDRRYHHRGLLVAAVIEARAGLAVDLEAVGQLVDRFLPLCGPDGWRDLSELAAATRSVEIWRQADMQAAAIVAQAAYRADLATTKVAEAVRGQLDRLKA